MRERRCTVDLWTAGCAGSRLTAPARSPMDKPWTTLCVAHRLPTGRRLPTSSTALDLIRIKSGKVKTISTVQPLAYSTPVAVQATVTTAELARTLLTHDLGAILELLAFVVARKTLKPDVDAFDIFLCALAFVALLAARYFFLRPEADSVPDRSPP